MARWTITLDRLTSEFDLDIFDFPYNLYGGVEHKKELEQMFLDEYFDDEIGCVPYEKWLRKFRAKFLKLLPYYNQLYITEAIRFDPLETDRAETFTKATLGSTNEHDYASVGKTRQATDARTADKGKLHTDTEDHAKKQYDDHSEGTEKTEGSQDATETKTGSTTDKYTEGTKSKETADGTRLTVGNSERDTTEHQETQSTEAVRFSDTPQSSLGTSDTALMQWLTTYTRTNSNGTIDKRGHETIDR